jgi:hypothetical protein
VIELVAVLEVVAFSTLMENRSDSSPSLLYRTQVDECNQTGSGMRQMEDMEGKLRVLSRVRGKFEV